MGRRRGDGHRFRDSRRRNRRRAWRDVSTGRSAARPRRSRSPADVERERGRVGASGLFDVDDLEPGSTKRCLLVSGRSRTSRRSSKTEVESFRRRYLRFEMEPLVAALRQAEMISEQELERTLRDLGDVDPATAERIEHLSRTLVKKLLHEPTVRLRERRARRLRRGRRRRWFLGLLLRATREPLCRSTRWLLGTRASPGPSPDRLSSDC